MEITMNRLLPAIAVTFALAAATACGPAPYIQVNEPAPTAAPADGNARVYFVMPGGYLKSSAVVTDKDKAIGWLQNGTWFWVDVPAGQHLFMSRNPGNVAALAATLEAGKSYFVKIFVTPGFNANHVYLAGTCQADEDWANRQAWITTWKQIKGNPEYMIAWDASYGEKMAVEAAKVEAGDGEAKLLPAECGE